MARASNPARHSIWEPMYETDPVTGGTIEIFYAHRQFAASFGAKDGGFFWWRFKSDCLLDGPPIGPFGTSYAAYRNAMKSQIGSPTSDN
jgi:hypothetical protein